ncbi:GtrA family protein [Candidatus Peribacteria bacterium]|nr:GtrA family protein [Candidatus Peribacteria bacterium]
MYARIRPHLPQFFRYLMSGGGAATLELGSFQLMRYLGLWYLGAGFISSGLGLVSAFMFHKYFVFQKKENTRSHLVRYVILQGGNALAQVGLLYLFVEFAHVDPFLGKVLAIGVVVSWNFFLYKFFVYV